MLKILVKKCVEMSLEKQFWKLCTLLNKCMVRLKPLNRSFSQEKLLDYQPASSDYKALKSAIKNLSANLTQIPICIGETHFGSSDVHYQRMPHNTRCKISLMSTANTQILDHCHRVAGETEKEWSEVPMKERIEICTKCADILATEDRHLLNASMMLGQSKTYRQAEEDTCRTINYLRGYAELLSKLETDCDASADANGYIMRPTSGFIAAMTPYNWTSQGVNLALGPALMGNCVLWVPSPLNVLSSYHIYLALLKAGMPGGVISFIPMNRAYFMNKLSHMPRLAGLNYAGTFPDYQKLAMMVSRHMDRPNSFEFQSGPAENKNFHFVHESANVEQVAAATVHAAFDYNGQRGNSCENLYVPYSLWCDMQFALIEEVAKLKVGDVCDEETTNSAVIDRIAYNRIVKLLKYAELSENCTILCGGNYNHSHGNFIEPTIVLCNCSEDKLMTKEVQGPILSVCAYENNEINEILKFLGSGKSYTIAGSIFAENDELAEIYTEPLSTAAANLYINKACIGEVDGRADEMPDFNQKSIASQKSLLKHW